MEMISDRHIRFLNDVLEEPIVSVAKIPTGKFNSSYFLTMRSGKRYVLRIAPRPDVPVLFYEKNMMLQEPEIHRQVISNTSIPVADVVYFADNTDNVFSRMFIVFVALEGQPCSSYRSDMKRIRYQLGRYLRELHSNCTKREFGYIGRHRPMEGQANWSMAFKIMWNKLLEDIVSVGMYSSGELSRYSSLLDDNLQYFQYEGDASLCHMDIWTQNILTDGENITGIVDWDRSLYGDVEIEFSVVEYCGLIDDNFWRGYGYRPEFDKEFMIRRAFYMLYEHQKYIFIRAARNGNIAVAEQYRDECRYLLNKMLCGKFDIL